MPIGFYPAIHALLLRVTLRPDVADDLLQELFVKLVSSAGLRAAPNPVGYVKRAAINLAFDWRRAQRRHAPLAGYDAPSSAPAVLDTLADRDEAERVLDASASLSELSRQALILRCVQQESFESIASALGRTEHQARALYHAAVAQLRARLREPETQP